jgi:alpha-D-ribose 1-methylphosphonate 5-triphosphate synthase subunit PhnL
MVKIIETLVLHKISKVKVIEILALHKTYMVKHIEILVQHKTSMVKLSSFPPVEVVPVVRSNPAGVKVGSSKMPTFIALNEIEGLRTQC